VFTLSENCIIWLYGYTQIAQNIFERLNRNGNFELKGFLDQNTELWVSDSLVYSPNRQYTDQDIVIITLQSANNQYYVADMLHDYGCNNIIFAAAGYQYDYDNAKRIRRFYEEVVNGCSELLGVGLPCYDEIKRGKKNENIVREYADAVVCRCPVEILFTPNKSQLYSDISYCSDEEHWEFDAPLLAMMNESNDVPVIVRYLVNHEGDPQKYVSRISAANRKDMWVHEIDSARMWEYEYSRGGEDYFIDAAIKCHWNSKGYFNIVDGCHRACYLVLKRMESIPILISKDDYHEFQEIENARTHEFVYDETYLFGSILQYIYDNRIKPKRVMINDSLSNRWGNTFIFWDEKVVVQLRSECEVDIRKQPLLLMKIETEKKIYNICALEEKKSNKYNGEVLYRLYAGKCQAVVMIYSEDRSDGN